MIILQLVNFLKLIIVSITLFCGVSATKQQHRLHFISRCV